MKIYKITEASEHLGVSINTLKTLANNGKIKSFKTTGSHRRFRQEDLDAFMGIEKEKQKKGFRCKVPKTLAIIGEPCRNRTDNLMIKSYWHFIIPFCNQLFTNQNKRSKRFSKPNVKEAL